MAVTPHLGVTLVEQSQAQKEVTVNMALMRIDALLNSGAADKDLAAPPVQPAAGDVYIVPAQAEGDWEGHDGEVAYFEQLWRFISPNRGLMLWVADEGAFYLFDGVDWVPTAGGSSLSGLSDVTLTAPAHGEVLKFDSMTGGWVNDTISGGGGGSATSMGDITDVQISSAASGEVLIYDGGEWVNQTLAEAGIATMSHSHVLADITDAGALAGKSTINDGDWMGADLAVGNGGTGRSDVMTDCLLAGNGTSPLTVTGVKIDSDDCLHGFKAKLNKQTGASYTLAASDTGQIVECNHASAVTMTLPNSLPQGFACTVVQKGTGKISFTAASGAVLHHRQGHDASAGQYAVCAIYVTENPTGTSAAYLLGGDTE